MQLRSPKSDLRTPADLFTSRYDWLLRWAMQFARNDHAAAEDLMQETFLRFSQSNLTVAEIRDVEALLYTYLEHVHLGQMRELTRHSFVSLADAKLDALALRLLTGPDVERIESQNVLRRIAAYIAWRKQTSKAASIVALRFFHGYLPEEIARIAMVSRESVDERLHKGRNEVRLHLLDAAKLSKLQRGGPAEIFPSKIVVPIDALLVELRNQLFAASNGPCLPSDQFAALYRKMPDAPLRREQLAHIVGCSKCLLFVERIALKNKPPQTPGSSSTRLITMQDRGERNDISPTPSKRVETILSRAERRRKEIYEHRPNALIIAVNGQIFASRDIRAPFNGLKVEVPTRDLKFIDILNEYGLPLFSSAISTPLYNDPVTHRVVEFSNSRWLGVDLHFSVQKLVIEVEYHDSAFQPIPVPSFAEASSEEEEEGEFEAATILILTWSAQLKKRLVEGLRSFQISPFVATAMTCAALALVVFLHPWKRAVSMQPAELLQRAAVSERASHHGIKTGVILQEVSIRSNGASFPRSVYRDAEGKRRLKAQPLDNSKATLRRNLIQAGVDWDEPLSVSSFHGWRAHAHVKREFIHKINDDLLKLQVDTDDEEIQQETLTLRALDLHPIERTVQFHDIGTVEIAELNYAVIPWNLMNQSLFIGDAPSPNAAIAKPRVTPISTLTDAQLALTELQVRSALHDLHADSNDRLIITPTPSGIKVSGLIENEEQKREITHQLELIPHVSTKLTTLSDASRSEQQFTRSNSVQVASVVAEPSLLEAFLLNRGQSRELSNELAGRLFSGSVAMLRSSKALDQLRERFPPNQLSGDSLDLYNRLLATWHEELNTALAGESETIHRTGVPIAAKSGTHTPEMDTASSSMNAASPNLDEAIQRNQLLLRELIGHDSTSLRSAPEVLSDLARSLDSIHRAADAERNRSTHSSSTPIPSAIDIHP